MRLTIIFAISVLFVCSLGSEVSAVFKDGEWNWDFIFDEDIKQNGDLTTLYFSTRQRCVTSFQLSASSHLESRVAVERVSGVDDTDGTYTFSEEGYGFFSGTGVPITVSLSKAPVCASTWRIVISGQAKGVLKDILMVHNSPQSKKRATTTCDTIGIYPPECSSASDGAKCMVGGLCGCDVDTDCFGNTDFPFCLQLPGDTRKTCVECGLKATTANPNNDHLSCLPRYPGLVTHPTEGTQLPLERAAPQNYFREFCVRQNTVTGGDGACQRCNQATLLPFGFSSVASNQGASGTFFCNQIRPNKPICMDQTYMTDTGQAFNVSLRGACVPCTISPACARAIPKQPICNAALGTCNPCTANAQCAQLSGQANCQADGSCKSCTSDSDCGALDGGEKASQPSCNVGTGICGDPFVCTDNPSCTGKGGSNCQLSGACVTCTSNALCGPLDGGEVKSQPVCNTGSGICGPCSTNAQCAGTTGANCQASGACLTCTSNANCGTQIDGGEIAGQPICNTGTGICESACLNNNDCSNKAGKNCQKDGTCKTCLSDADCGSTDGGETPNQSLCSVGTGICITPFTCTTNPSCVGHGGANCQKDLTCLSCTAATCGALDGGDFPNQPNCNLQTRLCVDACRTNSDCVGTQGANCMQSGICATCQRNADCGVGKDGGEIGGQTICNTASGICESACVTNNDCASKTGKNCQADGSCLSCTSNANCGTLDGGEAPGQTECNTKTFICQDPFRCTTNPSCQGQPGKNCMADLSCKSCLSSADCGLLDGGEIHNQPICNRTTGICGFCTANEDCPLSARNCGADGTCYPCSNSPGQKGCGVLDGPPGGPNAGQPNCNDKSGVCVDGCTLDAHCASKLCTPFCNVDKGCCVECVTNTQCPHAQWLSSAQNLKVCSAGSNTCVKGCSVNADCPASTPGCAASIGTCVECTNDVHCSESKPHCHTTNLECTDEAFGGSSLVSGIPGIIISSIALFLVLVVVVVLIVTK